MMETMKNWFITEWKNKNFRIYCLVDVLIVAALIAEFVMFEYGWVKIVRYLILLEGIFGIAWIDKHTKRIPNQVLLVLAVIRTVLLAVELVVYSQMGLSVAISSLLGSLIGGGMFLLCYFLTKGGIGMGDVKLFFVIGYFLGGGVIMSCVALTAFAAAIFSIVQLIRKKTKLKDEMPFAPFVLIGLIITMGLGM